MLQFVRRSSFLLFLAACNSSGPVPRAPSPSPQRENGSLDLLGQHERVVESTGFRVELLDLSIRDAQVGRLRFRLTSVADDTVEVGVAYQIKVGGWGANRTRGTGDIYIYALAPGESREDTVSVIVPGYSFDTVLRLSFGPGRPMPQRPGHGLLERTTGERTYRLAGAPWAREQIDRFAMMEAPGVEVFVRRGMGLEDDLATLTHERSRALSAIAHLLRVPPPGRVRLVFYPDPILKWVDTGHWGTGLAFDSTIVEVVSASERMDPFESASFIGSLIHRHGMDRFLQAYGRLTSPSSPTDVDANDAAFRDVFGERLVDAEAAWRGQLRESCVAAPGRR